MVFSWLRNRRRKRIIETAFPAAWAKHLIRNVRYYGCLSRGQQSTVQRIVQVFVAEKNWVGGAGFYVTEEMKVTIAGYASLMVLGFDEPYYFDHVRSIIVYPGSYCHPPQYSRSYLIVEDLPVFGESWHRGPIVLAWQKLLASADSGGRNVVIHEFAHAIDSLDGDADGAIPLFGHERQRDWNRVLEGEYRRLVGSVRRGEATLLDQYGASNQAEFFAVATECFFERPSALQQRHEQLYAVLRDFYRQDPAGWLPDALCPDEPSSLSESVTGQDTEDAQTLPGEPGELLDHEREILESNNATTLFRLAVDCMGDQRYEVAERALSRVLELDPEDAEAYQHRAEARVNLGMYAEALADSEEALDRDSEDVAARRARGFALMGLRQFEQAKRDLDELLTECPNDAEAYYLRGMAWVKLGNRRKALSDFSWSIAYDPFVAEPYYHRAQIYREFGRLTKAEADLEKAFQLDPLVDQRHEPRHDSLRPEDAPIDRG